jgi:hypothetical protein
VDEVIAWVTFAGAWLLVAVMLAVAIIPTAIHTIGDYTRQLAAAEKR